MKKAIPNALTLLNLFCGCCAIAALFSGRPGAVLILSLICLMCDLLDGLMARLLNAWSNLGKELDSLADLVSFGLLPGFVLFYLLRSNQATETAWMSYVAFLLPVAAAYRLAKFNLDTRPSHLFYGLPVPSVMVCVLGIHLMLYAGDTGLEEFLTKPVFLYSLIVILIVLMLSGLKLWSIKSLNTRRDRILFLFFISTFIILLIWLGSPAFSLMVLMYVLTGLLNRVMKIYA